eukprot:Polyplicarium_translucidae@DN2431_c0_g1_i1.p2
MDSVIVKSVPDSDVVVVSVVVFGRPTIKLERARSEQLDVAIRRLRASMLKQTQPTKRAKRKHKASESEVLHKSSSPEPCPSEAAICLILPDGTVVEGTTSCAVAFETARCLKIGERDIPISLNPPAVLRLEFKQVPVEGCPLVPVVKVEHDLEENFEYTWAREENGHSQTLQTSRCKVFTPSAEDLGKHLSLTISHPRSHENRFARLEEPVRPFPMESWRTHRNADFQRRHTSEANLRICSFNVLADAFAATEWAVREMYPYTPAFALELRYRGNLVAKEIADVDCDVCCLQECGGTFFTEHLEAAMSCRAYAGFFKGKSGNVNEGCATFYRTDRLELLAAEGVGFQEALAVAFPADLLKEAKGKMETFFSSVIDGFTQVFQFALFRSALDPTKIFATCNTHLFYHPGAPHVRIFQIASAVMYLRSLLDRWAATFDLDRKSIGFIFCGDLNSPMHSAPYHLLRDWKLSEKDPAWAIGNGFTWEREGSEEGAGETNTTPSAGSQCVGVEVALPDDMKMRNAYEGTSLAFTNFVKNFQMVLDYIFISPHFVVSRVLCPVDRGDLLRKGGIPTEGYPSDHLSVAAELCWSCKREGTSDCPPPARA